MPKECDFYLRTHNISYIQLNISTAKERYGQRDRESVRGKVGELYYYKKRRDYSI